MYFNESLLEESFKTLFENEGYICNLGEEIESRNIKEVIIKKDLIKFIKSKYAELSDEEIDLIVNTCNQPSNYLCYLVLRLQS